MEPPKNWQGVFQLLKHYLKTRSKRTKQVIFLDELPWMSTKRSGFIQLLAHLWNDYLSKENHFILVVCGSATSWITKKILNDKGGFHNRVTDRMMLKPFTLYETKQFLEGRKIRLTDQAISEIYMIMGGVPFYLEQIKKGISVSQNIANICFSETGILKNEYQNLYGALFDHAENHEAIVKTLAKSRSGLNRNEIIEKSKVKAGGPYTRAMEDLLLSGFIEEMQPFGHIKRGTIYRLVDEYSVFYHKFIYPNRKKNVGVWKTLAQSQAYKIWTGYAFETLCHKHVTEIKSILGIAAVYTESYSYRMEAIKNTQGIQVDLVLDRKDNVINLCECKYYSDHFTINKEYASKLRRRIHEFQQHSQTKKSIFNTLITTYGIVQNKYALDAIENVITVTDLINVNR